MLLKGAAAATFAVHELRLADNDALSSDLLRALTNKVDGLSSKLTGLVGGLKNGSVNPAAIASASGATDAFGSASNGLGVGIKDISSALHELLTGVACFSEAEPGLQIVRVAARQTGNSSLWKQRGLRCRTPSSSRRRES